LQVRIFDVRRGTASQQHCQHEKKSDGDLLHTRVGITEKVSDGGDPSHPKLQTPSDRRHSLDWLVRQFHCSSHSYTATQHRQSSRWNRRNTNSNRATWKYTDPNND